MPVDNNCLSDHGPGLKVFARDSNGNEFRGDLGLVIQRKLSPLVSNVVDDQAEVASGSDSGEGSEPTHSSDSGED